jgi:hypothetical protein
MLAFFSSSVNRAIIWYTGRGGRRSQYGRVHWRRAHTSILGSSSLSLARASLASSARPFQAGSFVVPPLSVQSDVVRCKVWLRRYAQISSCIGAPVRQHVQLFLFFFSLFSRCHIHRPPVQDNCGNRGMVGEHVDVGRSSPARRELEWRRSLYHVLRSNFPLLYQRKKPLHTAQKEKKNFLTITVLSDDSSPGMRRGAEKHRRKKYHTARLDRSHHTNDPDQLPG